MPVALLTPGTVSNDIPTAYKYTTARIETITLQTPSFRSDPGPPVPVDPADYEAHIVVAYFDNAGREVARRMYVSPIGVLATSQLFANVRDEAWAMVKTAGGVPPDAVIS